jgi:hypothetical protein
MSRWWIPRGRRTPGRTAHCRWTPQGPQRPRICLVRTIRCKLRCPVLRCPQTCPQGRASISKKRAGSKCRQDTQLLWGWCCPRCMRTPRYSCRCMQRMSGLWSHQTGQGDTMSKQLLLPCCTFQLHTPLPWGSNCPRGRGTPGRTAHCRWTPQDQLHHRTCPLRRGRYKQRCPVLRCYQTCLQDKVCKEKQPQGRTCLPGTGRRNRTPSPWGKHTPRCKVLCSLPTTAPRSPRIDRRGRVCRRQHRSGSSCQRRTCSQWQSWTQTDKRSPHCNCCCSSLTPGQVTQTGRPNRDLRNWQ